MSWAKADDRYDDTPKIKRAWRLSGYAVGLHWMAVTSCARHESDGLIDPEWLAERLAVIPRKAAVAALKTLVSVGLFEELPAGETRSMTDEDGNLVTVGPLPENAYIVHDYLDYNPSSAQSGVPIRTGAATAAPRSTGAIGAARRAPRTTTLSPGGRTRSPT
jgi:hypothetical protein